MSTIVTRYGKGSPLTWLEVDNNFTNLNTDKIQSGDTVAALTITSATINGGSINGTTIGASTASSGVFTSLSDSGNLTFTGTGNRILGDFGNATVANRVAFQTSTTNSSTAITIIPNGTGSNSQLNLETDSAQTNGVSFQIAAAAGGTDSRLQSGIRGTGTYLPMTFYTGGSERMRITSAGNVGIGTSSPNKKLEIYENNTTVIATELLRLNNPSINATNNGTAIGFYQGATPYGNIRNYYTAANGWTLNLGYAATGEAITINSNNFVGIGTSSPGVKLDVFGGTTASGALSNVARVYSSSADVGTYYNATKLALQNNNSTSGTMAYLGYVSANGNDYAAILGTCTTHTFGAAVGYLSFLTNNGSGAATERMRIDSSGNVGIGTSSPGNAKLNVQGFASYRGDAYTIASFSANSTLAPLNITQLNDGTIPSISAGQNSTGTWANGLGFMTSGTERMRIHSSGGVSIGNTTDSGLASLNVSGSMSGGYIAHAAGTTAMAFGADNVVRVTPNATATYTSTVPAAGAICVLSILTSGTTSYTITFGTGFKSTGTLATGTVSARYFNITFVSDGTNLIETSRTVAIA